MAAGRTKGGNKPIKPKFGIPPKAPTKKEIAASENRIYYCTSCGRGFSVQAGNFSRTNSPFYAANNSFGTICNQCVDHYEIAITDYYNGDNNRAIERLAMAMDIYINESILQGTRKVNSNQSKVRAAFSKSGLTPNTGKCYTDRWDELVNGTITSVAQLEVLKETGTLTVPEETVERWGVGVFTDDDYRSLDKHYFMLKKHNPNADANQEIFIKDLCYIKLQQLASIKASKNDDFDKLTKLYRDTFKQAGLKTVTETDESNNETLGVTLAAIAQYTPEEYYKDKTLYKDFDGIGDYIKRFVLRPLRNLIKGETERDNEYSIKDGEQSD